jgi:hypothetical protein
MTLEKAKKIFQRYGELERKAKTNLIWSPTWFDRQIIKLDNHEEKKQEPQGKQKKTEEEKEQAVENKEQQSVHHNHKQQATKIPSGAATFTEDKRYTALVISVAELQENNVELLATIGTMKENQHRDPTKMISLQTQLEETNRKIEGTSNELKKCRSSIQSVETRLSSLSTADNTNKRFDRIESILVGAIGNTGNQPMGTIILACKQKVKVVDMENEQDEEDENFVDSQDIMETEEQGKTTTTILTTPNEGTGYQTNSQQDNAPSEMRLK